tara:strand:+ start:115 stop:501 length:387 start_codon:yes stop_codon:yes gene_type:complete
MKKIILIISFIPLLSWSQSNNTYKEFNFGVALFNDSGFPGLSFLFGNTNYFSNNTLLDYQIGAALPSVLTGKVGFGMGNEDFATIIGFRPWPTCPYLQFSFNERYNLSVEYGFFGDYEVTLITCGLRF